MIFCSKENSQGVITLRTNIQGRFTVSKVDCIEKSISSTVRVQVFSGKVPMFGLEPGDGTP